MILCLHVIFQAYWYVLHAKRFIFAPPHLHKDQMLQKKIQVNISLQFLSGALQDAFVNILHIMTCIWFLIIVMLIRGVGLHSLMKLVRHTWELFLPVWGLWRSLITIKPCRLKGACMQSTHELSSYCDCYAVYCINNTIDLVTTKLAMTKKNNPIHLTNHWCY